MPARPTTCRSTTRRGRSCRPIGCGKVLLVGPGNVYLQNAFSLLPNVELYGATAERVADHHRQGLFDLIVFDGFLPADLPDKPILAFAPPADQRRWAWSAARSMSSAWASPRSTIRCCAAST